MARANRIMRQRGPLGLLARAEELKRCFRYPPDMDAHVQAIIDRSVTMSADGGAAACESESQLACATQRADQ
jgi:hypothetical protein